MKSLSFWVVVGLSLVLFGCGEQTGTSSQQLDVVSNEFGGGIGANSTESAGLTEDELAIQPSADQIIDVVEVGSEVDLEGESDAEKSLENEFQKGVAVKLKSKVKQAEMPNLPMSAFEQVEWPSLMPKEDLDALLNPPSYVTDVEDGSLEDQISSQMQNAIGAASDDRYQQALSSTNVIAEFNGKAIRIPGFVVPLEFDDDQTITQFFLVPFFGACIHVPPPPPNQIIFVDYPAGLKLTALYDPFWIYGVLKTNLVQNDMAVAAYSLQMEGYEPYVEN